MPDGSGRALEPDGATGRESADFWRLQSEHSQGHRGRLDLVAGNVANLVLATPPRRVERQIMLWS